MALQKEKTLRNGAVGNYWKIVSESYDRLSMKYTWSIALFKDQATARDNKVPLDSAKEYSFIVTAEELASEDRTALGYTKIKAKAAIQINKDLLGHDVTPYSFDADLDGASDV